MGEKPDANLYEKEAYCENDMDQISTGAAA